LTVDLERLRARFPILELVEEGLTQTEIGKVLGIDQRRVSEQIKQIAQWYRSHWRGPMGGGSWAGWILHPFSPSPASGGSLKYVNTRFWNFTGTAKNKYETFI
jgi:hypothetical protein